MQSTKAIKGKIYYSLSYILMVLNIMDSNIDKMEKLFKDLYKKQKLKWVNDGIIL